MISDANLTINANDANGVNRFFRVIRMGSSSDSHRSSRGFTLIELLVVIAIIAVLATLVIVALDPIQRFADARNSRRWGDINSTMTAIHQYIVDNDGTLPTGLTTSQAATELGTCGACDDLSTPLAPYLKTIPIDPSNSTAANTSYTVAVDANNIITIVASNAESPETTSTLQISR
jgi:prepilin-type N-terminal cleavage/methylation domain-containing protein